MVWLLLLCTAVGAYGDLRAAALAGASSFLLLLLLERKPARAVAAGTLCAVAAAWGLYAYAGLQRDRAAYATAAEGELSGRVVGFPATGRYGSSFVFETRVAQRRVRIRVRAPRFDVRAGERLTLRGSPRHLPYELTGLAGEFRAGRIGRLGQRGRDPLLWSGHRRLRTALSRRLGSRAGVPLALALGERGLLDRGHRDRFVRLGISHLFALSGMHLGVVAAMVLMLAGGAGRWSAALVPATMAAYVALVGDIDSLQRALAMALLAVAARALGRPVRALHVWACAACVLLWLDPPSVHSVGLQFSLLATLGVLVTSSRLGWIGAAMRGGRWPRRALLGGASAVAVGVGATLAVLPVQLHYFGVVSPVGPFATVLFLPPVSIVLVLSLALALLDPVPWVGGPLAWLVEFSTRWLEWALSRAAETVPDPVSMHPPHALLYYAALAVLALAGGARVRLAAGVAALLSFLLR